MHVPSCRLKVSRLSPASVCPDQRKGSHLDPGLRDLCVHFEHLDEEVGNAQEVKNPRNAQVLCESDPPL